MARLDFDHIAWAKTEPERHRFSLAGSGVAAPDLEALGLPSQARLPRDGYGNDLHALERALAERIEAPGGRVLVTTGAGEALACVFAAFVSPGDEVVVESPGYQPHRSLAPMFGATVRTFARRHDRGFAGFVPSLEAQLTTRTRLVVVSHLHNPGGMPLDPADIGALDALAERRDLRVLCDETFRDLLGPPRCTLAGRGPRWITTSSLTKAYGLGGLRLGWVAGAAATLERCAAAQNAFSVDPSHPSLVLSLALMPHLDRLLQRTHGLLATNHALWSGFAERRRAARADRGTNGAAPDPGAAPTPDCRALEITAALDRFDPGAPSIGTTTWCVFAAEGGGDAFAAFASRRHDLAVTPGRFFGDPHGIRVALGSEPETFAAALAQFERALEEFVTIETRSGATA